MTTVSEIAEPERLPPGAFAVLRRIIGLELCDPLQILLIDGVRLERESGLSHEHRLMSRRIIAAGRRLAQLQMDTDDLLSCILGRPLELRRRPINADVICQTAILRCKSRSTTLSVDYKPQGNPNGEWDGPRVQCAIELLLEGAAHPEIALSWHRTPRSDALTSDWVIEVTRSVSESAAPTLAELHARRVAQAHQGELETRSIAAGRQHVRMRLPCRSLSLPID